ncbi:bifunctional (p)ppGpp synthetase/guanosine-3',5'-bis(diphosphate) 3'-pyrophosphohydrolase [Palleronia caenipelagi]|uniref:GTP pyrophosphokinase rsh n=2 Tax=Palleronia caenipelagi TaxID=2489174 RepID=A0A547Q9U3_9RHOB|nr:bifunctional (p)ppGpp synthetase/guanosine-3',5'-bis(diphosphate) 3'-pyrophosphohydrolase [Palleronia caenipelagi]TRD23132.1 bifunctional (p)ppGpp synthetase/guanosine-3',5'-bis(diphosphate) 3'-pyrophosphohydrolase [Palleronia caenipelagi]
MSDACETLVSQVLSYNPRSNVDLIRRAYAYADEKHSGQTRHSGEPYFTHPVAVAMILTEKRLDDSTIITALLHDTVEDTDSTYKEVSELFGRKIANLVDGVTKLTKLQLSSTETKQAENFRKLFMAMSRDVRVILVKLADRLHNMRTIKHMRTEKQVQKARETMDIYAPLAGRMGMQWMREELEDLAFGVLNPEARRSIIRRFAKMQQDTGDVVDKITADIELELRKAGIRGQVYGRAKRPFSIWRKMEEKHIGFSRLSDIYGFRVIVEQTKTCYQVLGAIHHRWTAVPGRFKDYISQPKSNGYRSLHTTVSGRDGKQVEVQIRTRSMHEVAETGVAAHWSYRDGVITQNPFAVDPVTWVSQLTEQFESADDHDEFLEAVKLEMYQDKVFCFTPKGKVIPLPKGATPLDFAYAIHTRVGARAVGAKVDGIRVPLWHRLRNGETVDIQTAEGQRPQAGWLDLVATGRAKSAIRKSLKAADRRRFIRLGTELLRVAFEHIDKKMSDKALLTAARELEIESGDELLARIGSAELATGDVIEALYPGITIEAGDEIDAARAVVGLEPDQAFQRAPCCKPLPGERIVGISYRGEGVRVHAIDCETLADLENSPDRWIDVAWHSGTHPAVHDVPFELTISNDAGVLGRVCTIIGSQHANISDLQFVERRPDFYRLKIDLELRSVEHLHAVVMALEAEPDVAMIERVRNLSKQD